MLKLNLLDKFLDGITMYRLVLYYLIALLLIAVVLSFFGVLYFSPFAIIFSSIFLVVVCYVSNFIFSYVFEAAPNVESLYITALILALIITPTTSFHGLVFLGWAGLLAMASKYILAIQKKHIFNPAAVAVAATAIGLGQSASWWVGTAWMAPFVFLGGILIMKKIQREDLVVTFFVVAIAASAFFGFSKGTDFFETLKRILLDSSLLFLGFVMLTEPLTTPSTKKLRFVYGALVGILFPPQVHVGPVFSTPELALLVGNVFSYFVSPKEKLMLVLKEKIQIGTDITDFVFPLPKKLNFLPGQYMEWTLAHKSPDSRGNRRYFTLASSPTEDTVRLGVKFYENGSSYKKSMGTMDLGSKILAGQVAGEFTLPKDQNKKLVFIAGGIGITPYRSILKYLIDTNQKREIVLFYSNKFASEIMYQDVFDQAAKKLNIKIVYTVTEETSPVWKGRKGRIDSQMVEQEVPDWKERTFYLSGPHVMVTGFEQTLKDMGVSSNQIKIDFFPGYA